MSGCRRSSRSASVNKRRELEEKLAKEQEERELRFQKSRSKSLQILRKKELDAFETEASR